MTNLILNTEIYLIKANRYFTVTSPQNKLTKNERRMLFQMINVQTC